MSYALRKFYVVFVGTAVIVSFASALLIRFSDLRYFPLVVVAIPIACLAANWASPVLAHEKRIVRHFALVGIPYLVATPLAAAADVLAVPAHQYFSAVAVYALFGVIFVPGAALIGIFSGNGRRTSDLSR